MNIMEDGLRKLLKNPTYLVIEEIDCKVFEFTLNQLHDNGYTDVNISVAGNLAKPIYCAVMKLKGEQEKWQK